MPKISAVGFAFFSPDGLRILFMHKPYSVSMHTDPDALPVLKEGAKNLVLVPNIDRLDDLIPLADKIHRAVVFARGKHEIILRRGIPLLDAVVQDDEITMVDTRTAERYCQAVENEAVEVELKAPENKTVNKAKPTIKPKEEPEVEDFDETTLVYHIDLIAGAWAKVKNLDFDQDFVEPSALFCVGENSLDEFKQIMKNLVNQGLDKNKALDYFRWIKEYQGNVLDAAREAIDGETLIQDIVQRYEISAADLTLIAEVYANQK